MNIDYEVLKQYCLSPIEAFKSVGEVTETKDGIYIYRNNPKAKILAVAHLDSVVNLEHFYLIKDEWDTIILNGQLDDRLGVYILMELLPQLGIEFDLLLTEGEEKGHSTARYFEPPKDYNWMFSFDRRLDDVVLYNYEDSGICGDLESAKFRIGHGSFSDICFLEHLGIRGFNVGTGYDMEHTPLHNASTRMILSQVNKFKTFYDGYQNQKYAYSPLPAQVKYSYAQWNIDNPAQSTCYLCKEQTLAGELMEDNTYICDECYVDVTICAQCDDYVLSTDTKDGICVECLYHNLDEWDG